MRNKDLLQNLRNKKIGILGFGVENRALVDFLLQQGIENITVCDQNSKSKIQITNKIEDLKIKFKTGKNYLKNLTDFDVIFRTPGLSIDTPELEAARKAGVEISSQIKLFFDLCPAKIVGVTGTKGKGTTTTLIYEILKYSYKSKKTQVFLGGNIGTPPVEFLNKVTKQDIVVLELSSFQLHDLDKSPNIAVILDVKSDHLDYHATRSEYVKAKQNIVRHQKSQDSVVVNLDYLTSFRFAALSLAKQVYYFSRRKSVDLGTYVQWVPKGSGARYGKIILREEQAEHQICNTYDITLRGEHNLENICGAITAARITGASIEAIRQIVPSYKGLEHRLEYVTMVDGVGYYNDSFSTTPETAIAAIKSFVEPIVLIAGGSDKGADYTKLGAEIIKSSVKVVIAIGVTGKKIVESIKKSQKGLKEAKDIKMVINCKNMAEIIKVASKEAKSGDVVVLSPASASFGMFKNYKDRGLQFKDQIKKL